MGYKISVNILNYNKISKGLRIRCIMLILEIIKNLGISLECNLDVHLEQK